MYVNIDLLVTIADRVSFDVVQSIKIDKSLRNLANSAKIELPREFKPSKKVDLKQSNLLKYINTGDTISIAVGYNGKPVEEFTGYITNIGAEIPIVLDCEDEMYKLKRTPKFNKVFANATLKNIVETIAPGYQLQCVDLDFGKFSIENATAFEVLEDLKKYGIRASFKGKILYVGMLIDFVANAEHYFEFGNNIRESSDLKYVTKEKKAVKIKAISLQKGSGEKVIYEFGEAINGERTLHAPTNLNQTQLKNWAEDYYKNVVFSGYEGSIDGWHEPITQPGDTLKLVDPNYPDAHRDGKFLIESTSLLVNQSDGVKRQSQISVKL